MNEALKRRRKRRDQKADVELSPTRVTLALEGDSYHFGALTDEASVPERAVPLDPVLVHQANARLAAEDDPDRQLDQGAIPPAAAGARGPAPGARFPGAPGHDARPGDGEDSLGDGGPARPGRFRDIEAGPGRRSDEPCATQVRVLGPLPRYQPGLHATAPHHLRAASRAAAPAARGCSRVLVVANPAADAPLPGAEREGHEVADAFEAFNAVYEDLCENRIEVVRLIGPERATRTEVLEHLMLRRYDVLHFAGHCVFDENNPALSGWIFARDQRISAYELNRVDRVPKFIFSNACESGRLSGKGEASIRPGSAPSFAESFFLRGVSNFVCTAWPVDDGAALEFAQSASISACSACDRNAVPGREFAPLPPQPMHTAMRQARLRIAGQPHGVRTWGAYQHYGNPITSFLRPGSDEAAAAHRNLQDRGCGRTAATKAAESDHAASLIAALSGSPGIVPQAVQQPAVAEAAGNGVDRQEERRPETRSRKKSVRS